MRRNLKNINNVRGDFSGVFERYGSKRGWKGYPDKTILLKDVRSSAGEVVSDHLWFNHTKGFDKLGTLNEGEEIKFKARVKSYVKGYRGYRDDIWDKPVQTDYRLSHPTDIRKAKSEPSGASDGSIQLKIGD
jgi:hypothetical protein